MAIGASDQFHALVEEDLNHERASALGRAGRRLSRTIDACAEANGELVRVRRSRHHQRVERALAEYVVAYDHYQRALTDFHIQREANRLFDHRLVSRFYPPPTPPSMLSHQPDADAGP